MSEQDVIDEFHKLLFNKRYGQTPLGWDLKWRGVEVIKYPTDLLVMQEILWELKPDFVIETGTKFGGSALFFASIMDMLGHGQVITVDKKEFETPNHPRITYLMGDSTSPDIIATIQRVVKPDSTALVCLDSRHKAEHVLKEIELYKDFVSLGSYLIVEDTKLNGNPVHTPYKQDQGPGPMEAVKEFLKTNRSFLIDKSREKFLLTSNPSGFLKRLK